MSIYAGAKSNDEAGMLSSLMPSIQLQQRSLATVTSRWTTMEPG